MTKVANVKECNTLCGKCRRSCRQPSGIVLVDCPRFLPYPFKVVEHRFDQLDLFTPQKYGHGAPDSFI